MASRYVGQEQSGIVAATLLLVVSCLLLSRSYRITPGSVRSFKGQGYATEPWELPSLIGWNGATFVDLDERPMRQAFKLYPWEWMFREGFGTNIIKSGGRWWEPPWKMVLSNKGILPILWEMYPEHPNLLPTYRDPGPLKGQAMVRKPILGREGCNIEIFGADGSTMISTSGPYDNAGYIYQAYAETPIFSGSRPNLGIWMVGDTACGMGVREDNGLIVSNRSRFVPHVFE